MTDYTPRQLQQMEQEAIQRLKEMQQRAQKTAEQQGWTGSIPRQRADHTEAPPPPPTPQPPPDPTAAAPEQTATPMGGLLQRLGGERGVLLALMALLMGEGADPGLLLALFWLAMGGEEGAEES